jgi:hypothetical protein
MKTIGLKRVSTLMVFLILPVMTFMYARTK